MKTEVMAPSEVLAANVAQYMRWRGFTQDEVADRMTTIGIGFGKSGGGKTEWHRRTVRQILNGQRRVDVDELFGLAVALETTVGALLSPHVGGIANFDMDYRIGDLDALGFRHFETLLADPREKEPRPPLVLTDWPDGRDSGDLPKWQTPPSEVEKALAATIAELQAKHPDLDLATTNAGDLLALLEGERTEDEPPEEAAPR